MLEGNENLAIVNDTAYRLCQASISWQDLTRSPSSITSFSSTWCSNHNGRYFSSLTNGYVYSLDTTTTTPGSSHLLQSFSLKNNSPTQIYEILFRSYSAASDKQTDETTRRITLHWDKMRLIPGRPGEVFFLLGITQTLYYSAFPGFISPLTSSIQIPSPGYAFGTPVLEVVHHQGRITSLEISSCGQMLATGDENGFVKLMMICRPESLKHTIEKKSHDLGEQINFECIEEEIRSHGLRAHLGPIFSMTWVNITEDHKQSKAFERSLSSPETREPWMYTDIEKVYFHLVTGSCDRFVRVWSVMWSRNGIDVTPFTQYDIVSAPVLALSSFTITKPSPPRNSSPRKLASSTHSLNATPSPFEHIIAASTESGLIYLWKINSSSNQSEADSHLVSMIHSSKSPLVNLTLNVMHDKDLSNLVVVASDIQGTARIHLSPLSQQHVTLKTSTTSTNLANQKREFLLFTLQGQATFESPIISCSFVNRIPNTSELSIFLMSGEMKLYPIMDLLLNSSRPHGIQNENLHGLSQDDDSLSHFQSEISLENHPNEETELEEKEFNSTNFDEINPTPPPTPISRPNLTPISRPVHDSSSPESVEPLTAKAVTKSPNSKPKSPSPVKESLNKSSSKLFSSLPVPPPSSVSPSPASIPKIPCQFSEPSLHSSKALAKALQSHPPIDIDNISISTIETTSTDRQLRANEIVNLSSHQKKYQNQFPEFTESEIERRMPKKISLRPQIDKKWKNKLQSSAPTEECLHFITPQDPIIHLNYVNKPLFESTTSDSLRLISSMGEPPSLQPQPHVFSFEVNINQIFDEINSKRDWESIQNQELRGGLSETGGVSDRSPFVDPVIRGERAFKFV